ncbi:MAG: hypothetical protein JST00_17435 [Deltaproteobacteria bacterium]|nr:hypothetical protein [Deltaproteobacteria bacterium]
MTLLAGLAIVGTSHVALAQPSATDKATADALFRLGKELLDAGRAAEACPKLAESQRIDPRTGTLLNLAVCHEQEGKTASAWAEFNEAAAQSANAKQPDREKLARAHIEELEKTLSKIKVVLQLASQGIEVKLDGKVLRPAALGTPIPVDPGPHTVEANAPLHKAWVRNVVIPKGPSLQAIEVPALEVEEPSPAAAAPIGPQKKSDPWPAVGLALFGVGSAALGAGVFFGLQTVAKKDDAERECIGDRCSQRGLDIYDDARTAATISTITIGAAVVLIAAGAYLVLRPPHMWPGSRPNDPSPVALRW